MKLYCCICLYYREGTANEAVTIIRGCAVCSDHMGVVARGEEWYNVTLPMRNEFNR